MELVKCHALGVHWRPSSIYDTDEMDLEIYNAKDRLFSSHALIVQMMCFLDISDMLYDLSHYNLINFHMQESHCKSRGN